MASHVERQRESWGWEGEVREGGVKSRMRKRMSKREREGVKR